ncbi:MAG TPA: glycerate kinase, partial [Candidatus Heimdallarchaeota archaeon]|nr:glycerate kinase [Candidatus Heimdallarchaeota archaeon]
MTTGKPGQGERDLRADLDRVIQAALAAVAPETCLRRVVRLEGDILRVREERFDLSQIERIVVVGMGKASARMAASLEGLLAERISEGLVVTAEGYTVPTERVEVVEASHPVPDARCVTAAKRILDLVDGADEKDLVVVLISGGGSALLTLPVPGIELADVIATNEILLRSGAKIEQVNTVRKHLSQVKGGQLAQRAFPAQTLALVLSDVPGDPLTAIASGPTVADPTTFRQAERILREYGLWDQMPESVQRRLEAGACGELAETPKPGSGTFKRAKTTIVGSGSLAAEAALEEGVRLGYRTLLLSTTLEGEAREVGRILAAVAREVVASGRPVVPPALILAAGETTVTVRGEGRGGRNQELALSAALGIEEIPRVVIGSFGTDGRDGPTDAAGAAVDGGTAGRMRDRGIVPEDSLAQNDAYRALTLAEDLIVTGPTGTNVADLCFVMVGEG